MASTTSRRFSANGAVLTAPTRPAGREQSSPCDGVQPTGRQGLAEQLAFRRFGLERPDISRLGQRGLCERLD